MSRRLTIATTPDPARAAAIGAHVTGIAVDVLRATTTLTVARANGAARIVSFAETAAAIAFRAAHPGALACGERGGAIVPGFDLGNSPFEYAPHVVQGRTLAFASTNGSRAMLELDRCGTRLFGACVSAAAVVRAAAEAAEVRIVCAGERGRRSGEDEACAGWIGRGLIALGFTATDDETARVIAAAPGDEDTLATRVRESSHGQVLRALGGEYIDDIEFCAQVDALDRAYGW